MECIILEKAESQIMERQVANHKEHVILKSLLQPTQLQGLPMTFDPTEGGENHLEYITSRSCEYS